MSAASNRIEFIVLIALMFAIIAFSIDAMLPALPDIAAELSPNAVNQAQLVVTSFAFGMGAGTLVVGPLSDAFGRRVVVVVGVALYILGAALAWRAQSLGLLLLARFAQGIGSSGPRVVGLAIVRDLYSGREMARIMSFVMMVFTIVPAFAPLIGTGIIALVGWRGLFMAFVLFALIFITWFMVRMPETLPADRRNPLQIQSLKNAFFEVLRFRVVQISIAVQTLLYAILFAGIANIQPIFDQRFDASASFPFWFGVIAACSATGSYINARLVGRFGMRKMSVMALQMQAVLTGIVILSALLPLPQPTAFAIFLLWMLSLFLMMAMTIGNLNAIAMEPVGHVAGMAASVVAAVSTIGGVLLTVPVSIAFDGTVLPLSIFICAMAAGAAALMRLPGMTVENTGETPPA